MSRLLSLLVLLACACSVALAAPSTAGGVGGARLLVQKSLDHHTLVPHNFAIDAPINVTLRVINVGDEVARSVKLEDSWTAGAFELSGPAGPWSWREIAPGASVNVSYFVTPSREGGFESSPARVSYVANEAMPATHGYSSSATNLNVVSSASFLKQTSTHTLEWSIFSGLLGLFVLVPLARYYELSSSYVKGGRRKAE